MSSPPLSSEFAEMPLPGFAPVTPVSTGASDDPHFRKRHRERLRARFLDGGAAAMPDYELLELLLFRAIPRQDVKPLAKRLIADLGDINLVLAATPDRLGQIKGVGLTVIQELKIVEAAAHRMARARVIDKPVLSGWEALLVYCKTALAHQPHEQFRVLFLDRKNVLIADEEQQKGTVDHVPVYPREVLKRALSHNASAIILVHNHPSGDPTPSDADIAMTRQIQAAGEVLSVVVHDHLVIGKEETFSFRSEGLI